MTPDTSPAQCKTRNLISLASSNFQLLRRYGEKPLSIPRYAPRHFRSLDTWRFSDWNIKLYGISAEAPNHPGVLTAQMVGDARAFVAANLGRMNSTPHYSVGFAILHHGNAAKSVLTQWWTNECVCLQFVGQSEFAGTSKFMPAKEDLLGCVYELSAVEFERRAWVSTVMAGKPVEAYLAARLPDGLY
jgi:hypothetical protein